MTGESTSPNGLRPKMSAEVLATLSSQLSPEQLCSVCTSFNNATKGTHEPLRKSCTSAMIWGSKVGAQQLESAKNTLKRGEELPLKSNGVAILDPIYKAADIVAEVRSGNVSTRLVSSIGGAAMVLSGIMSFIGDLFFFRFVNAIIQCYMVLFGAIVVIIEMGLHGKSWKCGEIISKNAQFLCFVKGRGAFYFFIGTLAFTEWNLLRFILGVYMMAVGAGLVCFGYVADKKFEQIYGMAQNISELQEVFHRYDENKSNSLNKEELSQLCQDLGAGLSPSELEVAFLDLDTDDNGQIFFDEFSQWWLSFSRAKMSVLRESV